MHTTHWWYDNCVEITCLFWQKQMKKKLSNFIPIPWEWPTECFKTDCRQIWCLEISFFNIFGQKKWKKKLSNFIPIPWEWPTECFKTDCGHKLLIEIYFFKSIKIIKVTFLILNHFPVVFLPLCLPVVVSPLWIPNARSSEPVPRDSVLGGGNSDLGYRVPDLRPETTTGRHNGGRHTRSWGAMAEPWGVTTGRHNGRKTTGKWFKMRNVTFIILILLKK